MKFALVGDRKLEAAKGLKGTCPSCGSDVLAKCGDFKVNHWAHKGTRNCEPW
jgi:competence CoiA-like predicted nuclease